MEHDIQTTAYVMAARELGFEEPEPVLVVATKAKKPDVQIEHLLRYPGDERELAELAVGVVKAIDAGVDYRNRSWRCRGVRMRERAEHEPAHSSRAGGADQRRDGDRQRRDVRCGAEAGGAAALGTRRTGAAVHRGRADEGGGRAARGARAARGGRGDGVRGGAEATAGAETAGGVTRPSRETSQLRGLTPLPPPAPPEREARCHDGEKPDLIHKRARSATAGAHLLLIRDASFAAGVHVVDYARIVRIDGCLALVRAGDPTHRGASEGALPLVRGDALGTDQGRASAVADGVDGGIRIQSGSESTPVPRTSLTATLMSVLAPHFAIAFAPLLLLDWTVRKRKSQHGSS